MKFSLAYSPCPNDTYIFEALAHHRIREQFDYDIDLKDVQELNQDAIKGKYDISKISFAAYPFIADDYEILDAGAALGFDCGPLLIARDKMQPDELAINRLKIAIPGVNTTANLLFSIAYPQAINKVEMLFSQIEDAVLSGEVDAGIIIHENRFTFQQKGLYQIMDLGQHWQQKYRLPIPLGCIVVRRSLPENLKLEIEFQIRKSLQNSKKNEREAMPYIKQHAQAMDYSVMRQHIDLYVNDYTASLGEYGRKAILFLFEKGHELGLLPKINTNIFVNAGS